MSFSLSFGIRMIFDPASMSGQSLLLEAADRQHPAPQGNLPGHGQVVAHGNLAQRGNQRRGQGDSSRRAILGDSALRYVNVNLGLLVEVGVQAQRGGPRAHVGERRVSAFPHHLAQLAGHGQLAAARDDRHLDRQKVASKLGPGQAGRNADVRRGLGQSVAEARRTQVLAQARAGDLDPCIAVVLDHLDGDFAAHSRQLALQVAHAGFARVMADDAQDRLCGKLDVLLLKPVGFALLLEQVALGDTKLLVFGIARDPDDFHAILQGPWDALQGIGGGDEQHLGEVVVDVQVMVVEGAVLFGVQHLKQSGGEIATEIGGHLVHLVEQEDRIARAGFAHRLDDFAGEGADIGATMAADFRLVVHTAQRHADELASHRAGNRPAQRGLAHARRSDQTQNGPLIWPTRVWTARYSRMRCLTLSRP